MRIRRKFSIFLLTLALAGCSGAGWQWHHPQGLDPVQRERDLADCLYYASITDYRAFGSDQPVRVQEWDEPVRECMVLRGWIFIETGEK